MTRLYLSSPELSTGEAVQLWVTTVGRRRHSRAESKKKLSGTDRGEKVDRFRDRRIRELGCCRVNGNP